MVMVIIVIVVEFLLSMKVMEQSGFVFHLLVVFVLMRSLSISGYKLKLFNLKNWLVVIR